MQRGWQSLGYGTRIALLRESETVTGRQAMV